MSASHFCIWDGDTPSLPISGCQMLHELATGSRRQGSGPVCLANVTRADQFGQQPLLLTHFHNDFRRWR